MDAKKPAYTGWKDEKGLLLYEGDDVWISRSGPDYGARVYWNGEFGRWMMRVRSIEGPGGALYPTPSPVEIDVVLAGSRFTRRVRGVQKIMG